MDKQVCVIVPVKRAGREFTNHIRSLLELDHHSYEIIIVDDGLEEIPEALKQAKDRLLVLKSQSKGPSYARNLAAKSTQAQYLAFTDSDCIVAVDWLKELLKGFEIFPEAASCGGKQDIPADATFFERKVYKLLKKAGIVAEYTQYTGSKISKVNHNPSCNVMYKRSVFLEEGGFLEGLWPGEDVELDYRLKKKGNIIVCNPRAVVYHHRPKDLNSFLRMMYRYGDVQGVLARRYGFFRKVQIVPLAALAVLTALLLGYKTDFLIIRTELYFFLLLLLLLIYFAFDLFVFFLALSAFIFWHCGFFKGIIKGR
ncbi:MAG: glycosyltransferase [Candidatus Omnitrophica bacterium]|nr:glycosyltransferase [Candidatus Omnitrophota bacterium]